jgi:hypothetical protein
MWDQHFQPENHLDVGVQGQQSIRDRKWRSKRNPVFNDSFNGAKRIKEVRTFYSARFKVIPHRFLRHREEARKKIEVSFSRGPLFCQPFEFRKQTQIWAWEFEIRRNGTDFKINFRRWFAKLHLSLKNRLQLKLCSFSSLPFSYSWLESRSHPNVNGATYRATLTSI